MQRKALFAITVDQVFSRFATSATQYIQDWSEKSIIIYRNNSFFDWKSCCFLSHKHNTSLQSSVWKQKHCLLASFSIKVIVRQHILVQNWSGYSVFLLLRNTRFTKRTFLLDIYIYITPHSSALLSTQYDKTFILIDN